MKRIVCAAAAVVAVGLLAACGSGGGDGPMATIVTDRPTPITALPTTPRSTPASPPTSTTPTTSTTATPTSSAAAQANSKDYAGKAPGWYYFSSPSGKFECGIAVLNTSIAGCHGSLPDSAPKVPGSGASEAAVKPNAVQLIAGSPAKFESLGDPKFHRFDGPAAALPYGEVLTVPGSGSTNGLQCSVDEESGVTCTDQVGHGFTVSAEDFDLR
ncbi:hypothetical protein O4220_26100 [Rhodococcus ruber]|uniref:Lipoprotein n=1 Tax=Rhodococcus ruber TaxID=1830 RepID=A0ABT4MLY3_9NOCA|nr:hypothetical protein [Rhodococcus ruber]MCZ4522009.1 hypothetical protein [Rhodococcus ruber]